MSQLNVNQADLDLFAANPSQYLLQLQPTPKGHSVNLMRKGFWTWIRIHVGSFFGLFNKNTLKLNAIAHEVFRHKDEFSHGSLRTFCDALDYKIIRWNSLRSFSNDANKIQTIHEHQGKIVLKFTSPSVYHSWINTDNDRIASNIIQRIGHAWDVRMGYYIRNGKPIHRTIQFTTHDFKDLPFSGIPNIQTLATIFREHSQEEKQRVQQELRKALALSPSVDILFEAPEADDSCQVTFSIASMV